MVMEIKLPMRRAMNELKKDLRNFLGDEWLYLLFEVVVPCVQLSKFTRLNHYDLCILLFIIPKNNNNNKTTARNTRKCTYVCLLGGIPYFLSGANILISCFRF